MEMEKHRKFTRWLKRLALAFGLVALLIFVAILAHDWIATLKLKAIHAQLEQESIPLSWPDFYKQFPNVETHLAAQSNFFAALDMVGNLPRPTEEEKKVLPVEGYAELPELGSNMPPAMMSAMESYLRNAAPALAAVREAVPREPFWLVPSTNANGIPDPSRLYMVRRAARLFEMSAILHSEKDEAHAAAEAAADGIRLAEILHRGSLITDELVRFACEGLALRSIECALAKTDPSPDALLKLTTLLSEHSDMRTGILGEIIFTKQFYKGMSDVSTSDIRTFIKTTIKNMIELDEFETWQYVMAYLPISSSGWLRMNEAYQLELLLRVARAWHLLWEDFIHRHTEASDAIPWHCFLPKTCKDIYSSVKNIELRAVGAWRCGRIALAIELYSQEHGALPRDLADLVPKYLNEIPAEPFHGQPFMYAHDGRSGTLAFAYPDSEKGFTLKVFASKNSVKTEEPLAKPAVSQSGTGILPVIHGRDAHATMGSARASED